MMKINRICWMKGVCLLLVFMVGCNQKQTVNSQEKQPQPGIEISVGEETKDKDDFEIQPNEERAEAPSTAEGNKEQASVQENKEHSSGQKNEQQDSENSTKEEINVESKETTESAESDTCLGTEGEVSFSVINHFLTEDTILELRITGEKAGYITYSMENIEPTKESERYETGLILEASETGSFPNCYTIAAKAWYEDGTASPTYVQTYFAAHNMDGRFTTRVMSIVGNPEELTEGPDGILYGDNVKKKGKESERKVHIELISAEGETEFTQFSGVRVYGGKSRTRLPIKPLKIYARKEYEEGKGSFVFDGFGTTTVDGTKLVTKYDKLVLRNGGDDFQQANIREELVHRLAEEIGFAAYESVIPVVVYLNGSYYGYYWLHESYCDKYFQQRNGKSKGEYIVVEGSDKKKSAGDDEIETAAAKEYNAIYNKYSKADLTKDENFEELLAVVDVYNYLDYMSFNLYISNYDWPERNYKCFRYYADNGVYGEGEQDGRWRFLIHDADVSFGCYDGDSDLAGAARKDLETVITKTEHERYSPMLANLMKREECKQYFVERMNFYLEEINSERIERILTQLLAERDGEQPYYFERLEEMKEEGVPLWVTLRWVNTSINAIRNFTEKRPEYIRAELEKLFGE